MKHIGCHWRLTASVWELCAEHTPPAQVIIRSALRADAATVGCLRTSRCADEEDDEEEEAEDEAPRTVTKTAWDWELLNDNKPIWLRQPSEVAEDEYNKFYRALSKVSLQAGRQAFSPVAAPATAAHCSNNRLWCSLEIFCVPCC